MALHRLSHSRASKQGVPSKPTVSTRPALVTIHPNTRPEVTMTRLTRSKSDLASLVPAEVGQKRKRGTTSSARSELKRRKSSPVLESDEEEHVASEEEDQMDQDEAELDSCTPFDNLSLSEYSPCHHHYQPTNSSFMKLQNGI